MRADLMGVHKDKVASLSKRDLESLERAEVVAQACRKFVSIGPMASQADLDVLVNSLVDRTNVDGDAKLSPNSDPTPLSELRHAKYSSP